MAGTDDFRASWGWWIDEEEYMVVSFNRSPGIDGRSFVREPLNLISVVVTPKFCDNNGDDDDATETMGLLPNALLSTIGGV
jgi:hypothetical protein